MILEEEETPLTVEFLTDQPFLINIFNELSKSGLINYVIDAQSRLSWSTQYEFSSVLFGGRMSLSKSYLEVYVFHHRIEISQIYLYLNSLSPTLELRFV